MLLLQLPLPLLLLCLFSTISITTTTTSTKLLLMLLTELVLPARAASHTECEAKGNIKQTPTTARKKNMQTHTQKVRTYVGQARKKHTRTHARRYGYVVTKGPPAQPLHPEHKVLAKDATGAALAFCTT